MNKLAIKIVVKNSLEKVDDLMEVVEELQNMLECIPLDLSHQIYYAIGMVFLYENHYHEARKFFTIALSNHYCQTYKFWERVIDLSIKCNNNPIIPVEKNNLITKYAYRCVLSEHLINQNEFNKALNEINRSIDLIKEYNYAYEIKHQILFNLDEIEDSLRNLNQAIDINPTISKYYTYKYYLLRYLERDEEAFELINNDYLDNELRFEITEAKPDDFSSEMILGQHVRMKPSYSDDITEEDINLKKAIILTKEKEEEKAILLLKDILTKEPKYIKKINDNKNLRDYLAKYEFRTFLKNQGIEIPRRE